MFRRWQAYYEVEPWGDYRADLRQGITSAIIANLFLKKGKRKLEPKDFLLRPREERMQSAENLLKVMSAMFPGAPRRKWKKKRPKNGISRKTGR